MIDLSLSAILTVHSLRWYVGWLMAPTGLFEGQLDRTYQNAWTSAETLLSLQSFKESIFFTLPVWRDALKVCLFLMLCGITYR